MDVKKHRMRAGAAAHGRRWLGLAALLYALVLAGTLAPTRASGGRNFVPFEPHLAILRLWLQGRAPPWALRDLAINLVLLAPFAVALAAGLRPLLGRRRYVVPSLLLSAVASAAIELAQLAIPSRATDISDVILNTAGAALGVGAVARWDRRNWDRRWGLTARQWILKSLLDGRVRMRHALRAGCGRMIQLRRGFSEVESPREIRSHRASAPAERG